jgi:hypothetical protein
MSALKRDDNIGIWPDSDGDTSADDSDESASAYVTSLPQESVKNHFKSQESVKLRQ